MALPYANIRDELDDYPEEWVVLERSGTGSGLLIVEWETRTGYVRVSGPVVTNNPPHAPAP